jgi:iron complex transport system substrate-binding protein
MDMKNKIISNSILMISFLFLLVGCLKDSPEKESSGITILDSKNRSVKIKNHISRVVSLAPNITETVFALGKGDLVKGRTDYCDYPEEVKEIPIIGNMMEPNIEAIIDASPDLVIASSILAKEGVNTLENLGISVLVLEEEGSFEGVYKMIEKMGIALKCENESFKLINQIKEKVAIIQKKVEDLQKPRVYYVVGFGEYGDFTAGGDTFIGEMIKMAGGDNIAEDVSGWSYSLENIIFNDPYIVICSKYMNAKEQLQRANGYAGLTAVKSGRLYEIDNNKLDRQGPRLADGLLDLAAILHGDIF